MSQLVQLLVSLLRSLRLWVFVHAWETGLRVRWGSVLTTLPPGIHLCIPVLDRVYTQNTALRTSNISLQTLTTRDGRPVVVAATITWRITDITRLYLGSCQPHDVVHEYGQRSIAAAVQTIDSADLTVSSLSERVSAADCSGIGIRIESIFVTDLALARVYRLIPDTGWATYSSRVNMENASAQDK